MKIILTVALLFFSKSFSFLSNISGKIIINEEKAENETQVERVFEDLEDEYFLAKIFFNSTQKRYYKKLDEHGKRLFLDAFWVANDPNPATTKNEFLEILAPG